MSVSGVGVTAGWAWVWLGGVGGVEWVSLGGQRFGWVGGVVELDFDGLGLRWAGRFEVSWKSCHLETVGSDDNADHRDTKY